MSNSAYSRSRTLYLVQLAILAAILIFLELTGIGFIKTLGLEFTIMTVPVIIGAIILGPGAGAVLGGIFGLTSFWQAVSGKSPFGVLLLNLDPLGAIMTTIPTRILMGLLCGLIFRALKKRMENVNLPYLIASLSGALLNTVFFMSVLILFYYQSQLLQDISQTLGTKSALTFIFSFVGVQGAIEALISAILGTGISRALSQSARLNR